jgi:RHS repeat-associated protein
MADIKTERDLIAAGANSSTLSYGAWRNRTKQVAVTSGVTETTIYVAGLVEKVTKGSTVEYRHQIQATPGTVAVYVRKSSASNLMYYLHRDHLGSPEMITNSSGTSLVKLSFSAYGERRDVDWDGPVSSTHLATAANTTRHGFTDHEHLDSVKLIHMGGRVYDPLIGRFLSRDPYIDGVGSSQGANGYGYVHNNPLSLWDPTGYTAEELEEILVTGRRSRWRSVYLDEIARFLSQPFAGNAQGGGGAGGANGATTPPAEPKEGGKEEPQTEDPSSDKCRIVGAAADSVGGAAAGATFAFLTGQGALAIHYALGGAVAGVFVSYAAPTGGMGAFVVATHIGAVTAARGGSSGGSFAEVLGAGVQAATPAGAMTIPTGAGAGAITGALRPMLQLGRMSSAIVGGHAGGMAAVVALTTSESISAIAGCP